ncbi:MAG: SH3-like domain-containing protein [Bacteroidia bacterium]|nr:SH3-like domain-containing protein [Bacteroidia bacterium]
MRLFLISIALFVIGFTSSCQTDQTENKNPNSHKIEVTEVLGAGSYTYLKGKENDKEIWLAVTAMDAKVGDVYYYEGAMEMNQFKSKELNRTFESVYFVDKISKEPITDKAATTNAMGNTQQAMTSPGPVTVEKKEIKIEAAAGTITVGELFKNKANYAGKTVKIKAEVTKFSVEIMKKNWIHLQDGTEADGKFDLTVTTAEEFKVGDIVTIEGTVAIDKDFGYGYFYDVLVEDAKVVK